MLKNLLPHRGVSLDFADYGCRCHIHTMRLEWMYVKCKMYLQQKSGKTGVLVDSPFQESFLLLQPLFQIPPHGFLNTLFKGCGGVPVELGLQLGGVYGAG